MTISLRSIKTLMHRAVPGEKKISEDSARLLIIFLERKAEELTIQASRIHEKENRMRSQVGARQKVILSPKHIKMAIEGKFSDLQENGYAPSEH
jgi:hypothetical protein